MPKPNCKVISGDSGTEIKDSDVTHVHGDLNADIYLDGHSELIVGGNVNPYTTIYVNRVSRIFVGGDFQGSIIGKSSYSLYIIGNHSGLIETGSPSSKIFVHGDFKGELKPGEARDALVSLQVFGYTDIETIKKLYKYQYTQFNSVFYNSNTVPGIYQTQPPLRTYYTIVNKDNNMHYKAAAREKNSIHPLTRDYALKEMKVIRVILLAFVFTIVSCTTNTKYTEAIDTCNEQEIKKQVKNKGDINFSSDGYGWRPIHCAVRKSDLVFVKWLIKNGADIEATTKKSATPLFFSAISDDNFEITKLLIEKGADVNSKSRRGGTPLLASARFKANKTAKLLVSHGANINYKDPVRYFSAVTWAEYNNNEELIEFFKSISGNNVK